MILTTFTKPLAKLIGHFEKFPGIGPRTAQRLALFTLKQPEKNKYDAIVLSVAHDEFKELSLKEIKSYGSHNHILYDVKYLLKQSEVDGRL